MRLNVSLRRLLMGALISCALVSAVACSKDNSGSGDGAGGAAVNTPPVTHPMQVADAKGNPVTLQVDDKTMVVAVASWCPYTRAFIRTLKDPEVQKQFEPYKMVFVLESDEWPTAGKQIKEAGGKKLKLVPLEEALSLVKNKTGRGPLVDPSILDALPGEHYFLPAGFSQTSPNMGFPSLFSTQSGKFDSHPMLKFGAPSDPESDAYKACGSSQPS